MLKNLTALFARIAVFAAGFVFAQQPAGKAALEEARTRKTAGDLQGALELLEGIVANTASDRNAVANALLEMGAIAETLSQSNKARNLYERVRTDFKDQTAEAAANNDRMVVFGLLVCHIRNLPVFGIARYLDLSCRI